MIATERLILRKPRIEDAADLAVAYADPETVRFIGDGSTATLEEVEEGIEQWLERWESWGLSLFSLERREDRRVLGRVGFLLWDPETWEVGGSEVELGWLLGREHWGHGYATEAASAVLAHAFGPLGLAEVVAFTVPANLRSRRVMERLGMTSSPADDFEHPGLLDGHPLRPHVLYRLSQAARLASRAGGTR